MGMVRMIWMFLRVPIGSRATLAAENLALRQQLIILQRSAKRTKQSRACNGSAERFG
jgi:hypothetical protein